jgi:NAD(P)-dependent dehydrogenase (short-subunit alcohol dehydrogenase family)
MVLKMSVSDRLSGRVAIITGAANGIGAATAALFAQAGAALGLIDKDAEGLAKLAATLSGAGHKVHTSVGNVTEPADIKQIVDETVQRFGPITLLVNNAGITLTRPFMETTIAEIDQLVGVNLKGLVLASQAVIPHMVAAGGGAIVHDASNAGIVGRPWQPWYGATKAGSVSLTKSMALAHARDGIRINCICPGSIDTPMLRNALGSSGNFEQNWRRTSMVIPLGRIGDANDIAYATLFLASDEAKYITGVALAVDGGRTAGVAEVSHLTMEAQSH